MTSKVGKEGIIGKDDDDSFHEDLVTMCLDGDTVNIVENRKRLLGNSWYHIPKPLLVTIFQYLSAPDLLRAGLTCTTWHQASTDELLWRDLLKRDFAINPTVGITLGSTSWNMEYKRLSFHTPHCQTSELKKHTDQVLHVSFAHNGTMFATCSKDGYVVIWNSEHPVTIKYQRDMTTFCWKFTHFSQFNQSDSLLLVSGVHFGLPRSTSGEIAVFSLSDDLELQCRVRMKPYDICGAWYSDQHFLSGDVHRLGHLVNKSVLWLNKASQETASEHIPIMNQMFRFYNCNGSSVRAAMFAYCPASDTDDPSAPCSESQNFHSKSGKEKLSSVLSEQSFSPENGICFSEGCFNSLVQTTGGKSSHDNCGYTEKRGELKDEKKGDNASELSDSSEADTEFSDDDELCVQEDMFLIFTTGSSTYSPHQIGIKRIKPISFPRRMDPGLPFRERIANLNRVYQPTHENPHEAPNMNAEGTEYDVVDHVIELHGLIIGMGLSPDHRYLYVNARPWPPGYVVANPLMPPPCAQQIDIHVIDLANMKEVGKILRSHVAYSPINECFSIALDVCQEYVASGAEDKHGYLWDRHYEICLNKYPHQDAVNCVAFNPMDSEMLVTVSDDCTVKVWHSKNRTKELGLEPQQLPQAHDVRSNCCGHRSVTGNIRRPSNAESKRLMARLAVQFEQ